MFLSRNKKNNVYPCKPQFYYIKVGFKGVKIISACFRDGICRMWEKLPASKAMRNGIRCHENYHFSQNCFIIMSLRGCAGWSEMRLLSTCMARQAI